jgi:D-alanine-D-alanine ligase
MVMQKKIRVGVIFGGRSGEHAVSLMSARSVFNVLDPQKYDVIPIAITQDGAWLTGENAWEALNSAKTGVLTSCAILPSTSHPGIYRLNPTAQGELLEQFSQLDVVFPVLHGTFGEDGTLQGLLELADLAYVGAGVLGSAVGMDKALFKDVMRSNNIPVVESLLVSRHEIETDLPSVVERAENLAPYPLFAKPVNLGSSVGITKCHNRSDLMEGAMDAARYDRRVLIERGVNAREIEVSVLGNDQPVVSIPGEILPSREFYDYDAKYIDENSALLIPAPIPAEVTAQIQEIAIRTYKAVDCAGMARVDFLLDKVNGQIFVGEINTIPGFTQISMYPKLWEASGLPYAQLVDRLIELALERKAERDHTERRFGRKK